MGLGFRVLRGFGVFGGLGSKDFRGGLSELSAWECTLGQTWASGLRTLGADFAAFFRTFGEPRVLVTDTIIYENRAILYARATGGTITAKPAGEGACVDCCRGCALRARNIPPSPSKTHEPPATLRQISQTTATSLRLKTSPSELGGI